MSTIIKAIIIIVMILAIAYGGLCVYSNCQGPDTGQPGMPDPDKATHSVYIKNTGGLILTSDYEVQGTEVGKRIFILHTFWEMRGQKFKFVDGDIVLNEAIFGEITVKRRTQ
jgi:hypothetical protein